MIESTSRGWAVAYRGGTRLVQTYDAGITVDQWATLLPVSRDGAVQRHVFEDCAHWWALAHHCLVALDEIHALGLADHVAAPQPYLGRPTARVENVGQAVGDDEQARPRLTFAADRLAG